MYSISAREGAGSRLASETSTSVVPASSTPYQGRRKRTREGTRGCDQRHGAGPPLAFPSGTRSLAKLTSERCSIVSSKRSKQWSFRIRRRSIRTSCWSSCSSSEKRSRLTTCLDESPSQPIAVDLGIPQFYRHGEISRSADEFFETVVIATLLSGCGGHAPDHNERVEKFKLMVEAASHVTLW